MPRQKKSAEPIQKLAPPPRSRLIRGEFGVKPKPVAKAAPKPLKASRRSQCPINLVLEAIGDNWSLLIIRDLMLRGHTGYQAFLRSEEGIATNILADRLSKLEQNGLITKAPDPSDARKYIYSLTQKGADLAPLLIEMILYSLKHEVRIDMPKEVVADIQRNKQAFSTRLIRNFTPRIRGKVSARVETEASDETLSLF